ncbi:MAG: site-specific integrase [Aquificota bacterium]|nr:site-specific integrase [Aquificota bacterium]
MNFARREGFYGGELSGIKLYREDNPRERFLAPDELRRLINACPWWLRPAVSFAALTGMRAGEIFSLRWEDVNPEKGFVSIRRPKSGKRERIPIHPLAVSILVEQRRKFPESPYVFPNSKGKAYYLPCGYRGAFRTAVKRAGLDDVRFHDLRHTFASYLVMSEQISMR